MTIFVNVTDAIGRGTNHGITRVERKLALALADRTDAHFVVMYGRRLWRIDKQTVLARLDRPAARMEPQVERFGVDRPTPVDAPLSRLAAITRRSRRPSGGGGSGDIRLESLDLQRGDVLFSAGVDWTHGFLDEAERAVFGSEAQYVGFCYDLIPIDHPEWIFPPEPERFVRHYERMARVARSILCISQWTRADFARHFPSYEPDRLQVLTLGSDAALDVDPDAAAFARSIFDGAPYAVYCATLDRRKNHQILYRAMREMVRRDIAGNLVFVGMLGSGVADLLSAMRHDPLVRGRIAHVTNCDDQHLAALYQHARFAVYPSMYEGWGLGVSEALAHGKRSVVASGSSLAEASFGTAREVHPLITAQWVAAMSDCFHGADAPAELDLPTWADTAAQLIDLVSAR
jgi:glycosyltransferase involved in cell wall biosynthesis